MNNQDWYNQGERRWLDRLSCGHVINVSTVIGDWDRPKERVGDPTRCFRCGVPPKVVIVTVVEVAPIPLEDWKS